MHLKLLGTSLILFFLASLMPKSTPSYSPKSKSSIAKSYLLGQKQGLPRKIKKAHHRLHLLHLMTPSGLHLSIGLILIKKFFKNKLLIKLLLFMISLLTIFWGDFHALRRMAIFGLTRNLIITFIIDLFLGGWNSSPYSFCLSFLFLGMIDLNKDKAKKYLARDFFLAQIIIAFFFEQKVYPLGFLLGFFLTPIICFFFPLYIFDLIFHPITPISNVTEQVLLTLSNLTTDGLSPLVSLFILSLSQLPYGILMISFLWPTAIHNLPQHLIGKKAFHAPPPKNFQKIRRTPSGYIINYPNSLKCRRKLYPDGWSTRCKFYLMNRKP